jgi:hypothetical protein
LAWLSLTIWALPQRSHVIRRHHGGERGERLQQSFLADREWIVAIKTPVQWFGVALGINDGLEQGSGRPDDDARDGNTREHLMATQPKQLRSLQRPGRVGSGSSP